MAALLTAEIPGLPLFRRGKVRDVFDAGEYLVVVASDRISAFDVVMREGIPGKGEVLTQMSLFWFRLTAGIVENHLVTADPAEMERILGRPLPVDMLAGRSMLVRRTVPFPVECVVRGYLSGSGWKEYLHGGTLAGVALPAGLGESARLPAAIFTPSTKEEEGHDRNLTQEEAAEMIGQADYRELERLSLAVYAAAATEAERKGIIIADTKFEFGRLDGRIILIDEVLTPDSSRFWPKEGYRAGGPQPSFDKQFVRDYLESIRWDKNPPPPPLPADVIEKTAEKYRMARRLLAG
jgi:phosphoribosylaminoimidazole-succinocarboxamide synthase